MAQQGDIRISEHRGSEDFQRRLRDLEELAALYKRLYDEAEQCSQDVILRQRPSAFDQLQSVLLSIWIGLVHVFAPIWARLPRIDPPVVGQSAIVAIRSEDNYTSVLQASPEIELNSAGSAFQRARDQLSVPIAHLISSVSKDDHKIFSPLARALSLPFGSPPPSAYHTPTASIIYYAELPAEDVVVLSTKDRDIEELVIRASDEAATARAADAEHEVETNEAAQQHVPVVCQLEYEKDTEHATTAAEQATTSDSLQRELARRDAMIPSLLQQLSKKGDESLVNTVVTLEDAKVELMRATKRLLEGDERAQPDFDRWDRFLTTHPEHIAEENRKADSWLQENSAHNLQALDTVRSFVPTHIHSKGREELELSGLPVAVIKRILNLKVLWLLRMDQQGIARIHQQDLRLRYDFKTLDLLELRAIFAWLPSRFENDPDGIKAEWRQRVLNKLKEMVHRQQIGQLGLTEGRARCYMGLEQGPFDPTYRSMDGQVTAVRSTAFDGDQAREELEVLRAKRQSARLGACTIAVDRASMEEREEQPPIDFQGPSGQREVAHVEEAVCMSAIRSKYHTMPARIRVDEAQSSLPVKEKQLERVERVTGQASVLPCMSVEHQPFEQGEGNRQQQATGSRSGKGRPGGGASPVSLQASLNTELMAAIQRRSKKKIKTECKEGDAASKEDDETQKKSVKGALRNGSAGKHKISEPKQKTSEPKASFLAQIQMRKKD